MVENSTEKTLNLDFNWKTVEEKWGKGIKQIVVTHGSPLVQIINELL